MFLGVRGAGMHWSVVGAAGPSGVAGAAIGGIGVRGAANAACFSHARAPWPILQQRPHNSLAHRALASLLQRRHRRANLAFFFAGGWAASSTRRGNAHSLSTSFRISPFVRSAVML